ncbi:MAG TPA: extracellular solute-binding protein [Nitrososphaeraceae archaeon]|jgi:molybdate/tungstate transport system substrate-binding protein|nr:extracellular solute-binding protein [Nitrososphaeraceae archaeon]
MPLPISMTCNKFIIIVIFSIVTLYFLSINSLSLIANTQQQTSSSLNQGKVFVMYAASLVNTFENMLGPSFEKNTGYTYTGEARGSLQIANMIIDGQRRPDVFVSASTLPIMKLITNSSFRDSGSKTIPLAQWLVKFASAEIVIAYLPNSHFYSDLEKARIGEIPWYKILSKQGFKFGRTDPELDPKGYYMIITAKLSNLYYHDQTIKQKILGDDRNAKQLFPEETLKTALESRQLDAIAAYKHEAIARGLSYITLPSQINLANPTYSDFYKKVSYTLHNGQTIYGEPIYFSITIPETVKNLNGSISFVKFLLSDDGEHILESQGLDYIQRLVAEGSIDKLPPPIRNMLRK